MTKTKGAFTSDMALMKLIYLATMNIKKKWTSPLQNWATTAQQLFIKFEGRMPLDLSTAPAGGTPRRGEKADRV